MIEFKKIQKEDWFSLSLIWLIFAFMIYISYAKWGNPVVDCFRNAYVPEQILSGNVLYKDLYYIYGPLVVYFNAILFKIFGINLNILYLSGVIISLIIINTGYYLTRQLLNPLLSCIFGCMYIILVVFRPGIFQYIFPYSYETLYGLFFLLIILVCLINYVKNDFKSLNQLYISSIIVSICPFVKQDVAIIAYGVFYIVIAIFLIFKKIKLKTIVKPLLITILLPLLMFGLLAIFIPINDVIEGLFPTERFNIFYFKYFATMGLSLKFLFMAIKTFLITISLFMVVLSIFFFWQWLLKRLKLSLSVFMPLAIILTCLSIFLNHETLINYLLQIPQFTFGWFQWAVVFILLFLIVRLIYFNKNKIELDKQELIVIIFAVSGVIFLFRNPLSVNLQSVNNFFIFPALLIAFYVASSIIPKISNRINNNYYTYAFIATVIIFSFTALVNSYKVYQFKTLKIDNDRGLFYLSPYKGAQIIKTIAFIEKYTTPKDTIFCPPEDLVFNFMTGRAGATKFYQLVPGMIKDEKEELQTIEELKRNNTKLILISTNDNVKRYGKVQWGSDYNSIIFNWITENYIPISIVSNYFPNSNVIMPYRIFVFINKNDYNPAISVF